jgi:hypothetical protein
LTLRVEDVIAHPELIPPEWAREQLAELDILRWTQRNLVTEKGEPLNYEETPYLKQYLRDFHPHIAVLKGAQQRITTSTISKILYFGDHNKVTFIYTFPTQTQVNEFSSMRFKRMVINSPYLISRMQGVDNASTKHIGDSAIYFRGTKTESQAISVPADILAHDELDFSDPTVKETFSPRLANSKYKYVWEFSTPSIPEYGIDGVWRLSDKNFWLIKCSCGKWQSVDYFKNLYRKKGHYYFGCVRCHKELKRETGQWIAAYPSRTEGNKGIRGYYMPQTINPVMSADYIVSEHEKLLRVGKEKIFYNFNLGKPYESGESVITEKLIRSRIGEVGRIEKVFIGVDQGDLLHIVVRGKVGDRYGIIHLEVTDRFSRVGELIEQYDRAMLVLDAMPNKHSAKEERDKHRGKIYIAYYLNQEGLWNPRSPDKEPYSVGINHTDVMDNTAAEWQRGDVFLSNALPKNMIDLFANQMTKLKKTEIEDARGQNIPKWVKVGPDHFRHADAYSYIATQIGMYGDVKDVLVGAPIVPISNNMGGFFTERDVW